MGNEFKNIVVDGKTINKYVINKEGVVKNDKGHIIKPNKVKYVNLYLDGVRRSLKIEDLVNSTFNPSHIDCEELYFDTIEKLKELGVKNSSFFLKTLDSTLENISPYGDLTEEQQKKILEECENNPWYFMRECVRYPSKTGIDSLDSVSNIELNINRLITYKYIIEGINTYINSPRTTYTTTTKIIAALYLAIIKNKKVRFITKYKKPVEVNIMSFYSTLPNFIKDKAKGDIVKNITVSSSIHQRPYKNNETIIVDEFELICNANKLIPSYKKLETVRLIHLGSTVNDQENIGFDPESIIKKCIEWKPEYLDLGLSSVKNILRKSPLKMFYIKLDYRDLVKNHQEWLEKQCKELNYDPECVRKEIMLRRKQKHIKLDAKDIEIMPIVATKSELNNKKILSYLENGWVLVRSFPAFYIDMQVDPDEQIVVFVRTKHNKNSKDTTRN